MDFQELGTQDYLEAHYGPSAPFHNPTFHAHIEQPLPSRSSKMLYERAAELGVTAQTRVLDVGCGRGTYACGFASRFGCQVIGIDPSEERLQQAQSKATKIGVGNQVSFQVATMHALPFKDASFDFLFCRRVVVHVPVLTQGLVECARVLKPTGSMLLHTILATDLLESQEAAWLYRAMAFVPENMSAAAVTDACQVAGWEIEIFEDFGSEWFESGASLRSPDSVLQRVATMRRLRAPLVAEFGQLAYDVVLAILLCHVYPYLGKLSDALYTLRKKGDSE